MIAVQFQIYCLLQSNLINKLTLPISLYLYDWVTSQQFASIINDTTLNIQTNSNRKLAYNAEPCLKAQGNVRKPAPITLLAILNIVPKTVPLLSILAATLTTSTSVLGNNGKFKSIHYCWAILSSSFMEIEDIQLLNNEREKRQY